MAMATKIISYKILIFYFINIVYVPIAQIVSEVSNAPDTLIFYIFVSALFIPEVAIIISKEFRTWLKNAAENNDGVFSKIELKETITYLGSYYCAKLFAFLVLSNVFYNTRVDDAYIYLTFSGFAGTTGIVQIAKIFKKE